MKVLPDKLQEEMDRVMNEYFNDDIYIEDGNEIMKRYHASQELIDFLAEYRKEVDKYAEQGIILN